MADPTLADLLQGRMGGEAFLPRGYFNRPLDLQPGPLVREPVWGGLMPQSEEERYHHSPNRLADAVWGALPPVAVFRGGRQLAQGVAERDPWGAGWGAGQVALSAMPFFAWGRPAASPRPAPAPAPRAPAAPAGPWTPGHMDEWLASRPAPVPRHEINLTPARPVPPPRAPDVPGFWRQLDEAFLGGPRPSRFEEVPAAFVRGLSKPGPLAAQSILTAEALRRMWRDRQEQERSQPQPATQAGSRPGSVEIP